MKWKKRRRLDLDFEIEENLLPVLCDKKKIGVDVGAADGRYTAKMLNLCAKVISFEPFPFSAEKLRVAFRGDARVTIEEVALSNVDGLAMLYSPKKSSKLSTIEIQNSVVSRSTVQNQVQRKRLDSYSLAPVGFIKIDTEGHEYSILKGAWNTILVERPNILVEIEERHNAGAFDRVKSFMLAHNYSGFFVQNKNLLSIEAFNVLEHQQVSSDVLLDIKEGRYIHNFLYLPNPCADLILKIRGLQQ